MNISLLCPTRIRPKAMKAFFESAIIHATYPTEVQICFYIDDDDHRSIHMFKKMQRKYSEEQVKAAIGPRIMMSDNWNKCWEIADADIGCLCADDFRVTSQGWDEAVIEQFDNCKDKILWVVGNDCNAQQENNYGTFGFLHRRWITAVGYFTPPIFSSDWCDTWINHVANMLGRRVYDRRIVFDHLHPSFGKGVWDDLHKERLQRGERDNVQALYNRTLADRERDAAHLRRFLGKKYHGADSIKKIKKPQPNLSILIPTLNNRKGYLNRLLENLENQIIENNLQEKINIVIAPDNGESTIGVKRNHLTDYATGLFRAFIDDDDTVPENYCKTINDIIENNKESIDYIGFNLKYIENGNDGFKTAFHTLTKGYRTWCEDEQGYYRPINHLNPIRTEIARKIQFPASDFGEDGTWCEEVLKQNLVLQEKEYYIDEIMYVYDFWNHDLKKVLEYGYESKLNGTGSLKYV